MIALAFTIALALILAPIILWLGAALAAFLAIVFMVLFGKRKK